MLAKYIYRRTEVSSPTVINTEVVPLDDNVFHQVLAVTNERRWHPDLTATVMTLLIFRICTIIKKKSRLACQSVHIELHLDFALNVG
jgi:hypothetical protein